MNRRRNMPPPTEPGDEPGALAATEMALLWSFSHGFREGVRNGDTQFPGLPEPRTRRPLSYVFQSGGKSPGYSKSTSRPACGSRIRKPERRANSTSARKTAAHDASSE